MSGNRSAPMFTHYHNAIVWHLLVFTPTPDSNTICLSLEGERTLTWSYDYFELANLLKCLRSCSWGANVKNYKTLRLLYTISLLLLAHYHMWIICYCSSFLYFQRVKIAANSTATNLHVFSLIPSWCKHS